MSEHEKSDKSEEELADILSKVLDLLTGLAPESRQRLIETVATFFNTGITSQVVGAPRSHVSRSGGAPSSSSFSEDRSLDPKEFLLQKNPQTDVERVACLAYYLTHYRGIPHFKTADISKLNTEAAQVKFSNATVSVNNATKLHYLTTAGKGNKQITSIGEQFVLALPDRDAAKAVMAKARQRRRHRKSRPQDETA